MKQDMVERFAAGFCRSDEDAQVFARRLLADELVECLGAKRSISVFGCALGGSDSGGVGRHYSIRSMSGSMISNQSCLRRSQTE